MTESNQRKLGAILSYASVIIGILIQLLYTPILISKLGQSEYGLYSLISSIIGYLTVLDLGFGNAMIVYTAKYRAQKKYDEEKKLHGMFKLVFRIIALVSVVIGIILFFNVENLFSHSMTKLEIEKSKIMMIILTVNLAFTFSFTIYSSIISAYEKFVYQKILSIVNILLKPLLMIPLLLLGYKSITMCIIITLINIFILFLNYYYCKTKLKLNVKYCGFDKNVFKQIFGYSIFIFLGVIVEKINWSLDQFILGSIVGTIEISIYAVSIQFVTLYRNLSSCCCSIMLPKLSKMVGKNASNEELNNEFIKFGRLQWYFMSLLLFGLIIYGYEFIKIWAGESFGMSYYILLILLIPEALVLVENIGVYIMQAKNLHKPKAIIAFITAILNVIISIFLAKKYGAIGTSIGTAMSLIICNLIIINIYYQKKVKLDVVSFWKNILKISIPLIPIFLIALYINIYMFRAASIISIGVSAIVFSITYFLTAYRFSFNQYEKDIVKSTILNILQKVRKLKCN